MIDSHSIDISIVCDSPHVFYFWGVGEEAHSLEPAISKSFVDGYCYLVFGKFIENRAEHVHACIFPEASFVVEKFMANNISDCGQFVIGTTFVEIDEISDDIIGEGKAFSSDVFFSPEFHFIVGVDQFSFSIEILFGWGQIVGA